MSAARVYEVLDAMRGRSAPALRACIMDLVRALDTGASHDTIARLVRLHLGIKVDYADRNE